MGRGRSFFFNVSFSNLKRPFVKPSTGVTQQVVHCKTPGISRYSVRALPASCRPGTPGRATLERRQGEVSETVHKIVENDTRKTKVKTTADADRLQLRKWELITNFPNRHASCRLSIAFCAQFSFMITLYALVIGTAATEIDLIANADIANAANVLSEAVEELKTTGAAVEDSAESARVATGLAKPPVTTRIGPTYTPFSAAAKTVQANQNDCALSTLIRPLAHCGLGCSLHCWSSQVETERRAGRRLVNAGHWLWTDETRGCGGASPAGDPFACYFKVAGAPACAAPPPHMYVEKKKNQDDCAGNGAAIEFLFTRGTSAMVQREVARQIRAIFGHDGVPDDLITVHIRWGDKWQESKLLKASIYVDGVKELLRKRGRDADAYAANIYLATEDPKAFEQFERAAPSSWTVFRDQTVVDMAARGRRVKAPERAGVVYHGAMGTDSIVSLVIAMEANDYVLTMMSNWSRLMDELRLRIVDQLCGGCTNAIKLRQETNTLYYNQNSRKKHPLAELKKDYTNGVYDP